MMNLGKVSKKSIMELTEQITLSCQFGIMGTIRPCDNEGFEFTNHGMDGWVYIGFKSAVKLRKELRNI